VDGLDVVETLDPNHGGGREQTTSLLTVDCQICRIFRTVRTVRTVFFGKGKKRRGHARVLTALVAGGEQQRDE